MAQRDAGAASLDTPGSGAGDAGMLGDSGDGSAASDASAPPTASDLTPYQACVLYVDARCNRFERECQGAEAVDNPCPRHRVFCPDVYFAEGSTITVDDLVSCAAQWASHPCELAQRSIGPECLAAGALASGEPCRYRSQCTDGHCAGESADCSRCAPEAERDGSCSDELPCPSSQRCEDGTCVLPYERLGQPVGEECDPLWGTCELGLWCFADSVDGVARCQPRPQVGEPCPSGARCAAGAVCEAGTCLALPGAGQPCYPWLDDRYVVCAPGAYCDEDPVTPMCHAPKGAGEACTITDAEAAGAVLKQPQCDEGMVCGACDDRDEGCTGVCEHLRWEGEDCAQEHTRCARGTECVGGVCVGVGLQGDDGPLCS